MGQGYSGAYRGTTGADNEPADPTSSIAENARRMSAQFPISRNGYFGIRDHKQIRVISCIDPIETSHVFFQRLTHGATHEIATNNRGMEYQRATFADGSIVTYRVVTSTPDSPAVQISVTRAGPIRNQKIHFTRKETLW